IGDDWWHNGPAGGSSTAAPIRSRTSSPVMPARTLMASRSQQSSANATRTRSPFVAADLKAVGAPPPITFIHRNAAVMAPLVSANVAIEQQAVNLGRLACDWAVLDLQPAPAA